MSFCHIVVLISGAISLSMHFPCMGRQIDEQFGVNNKIYVYDRSKENPLLLTEKKIYKHQNTKEIDKRILCTF
jgi:hypothetical protein